MKGLSSQSPEQESMIGCLIIARGMAMTRSGKQMNKSVVLIGTQWGDEGKGKIVDLLPVLPGVVRFQGGHNAGHTLVVEGRKRFFI